MTYEEIERLFTYHPPNGDQPERYQKIRDKAKELAHTINSCMIDSAEKRYAIMHLQIAVMMANASIAINE